MTTLYHFHVFTSSHELMKSTIHLLLRRGADPNASSIPMPVLLFAIKAADVDAVRLLLSKGASTSAKISQKVGPPGIVLGEGQDVCIMQQMCIHGLQVGEIFQVSFL